MKAKKAKKRVKETRGAKGVWKDEYYVDAYILARQGLKSSHIAATWGITTATFLAWKKKKPVLRRSLELARQNIRTNFQAGFRDYVYKRLPDELKDLWDEINACEKEKGSIARLEAILEDQGEQVRQHLFLYALVDSNFNPAEACRRINIPRHRLDAWITKDPDFGRIIDQMHIYKGDLFEQGLIDLVVSGNDKAIIFANKTFNKNRGYNEKVEVEHTGQVNHTHTMIDIDSLDLSLEVRAAILQAIRDKRAAETQQALPAPNLVDRDRDKDFDDDAEDAEFEEVY